MAVRAASKSGMRVLLVGVLSSELHSLRQISIPLLPVEEMDRRLETYRRAMRDCPPVSSGETRTRSCLRLGSVLADLDVAVGRVVSAWSMP